MKTSKFFLFLILSVFSCGALTPGLEARHHSTAGEKVDDAIDYTKDKVGKAKDQVKKGVDKTKEGFDKAKDKTKEGFDKAKEKAKKGVDKTKDKAKTGLDKTKKGIDNAKEKLAVHFMSLFFANGIIII